MKIKTFSLYIFLLLRNNCQVQGIVNSLESFSLVQEETRLSIKFFEIMNIYYTTVFTVTIYDQMEDDDLVKAIYRCSFECKSCIAFIFMVLKFTPA